VDELREKLESLDLPEAAQKEVERELARLERAQKESMEGQVIRNYLEWIAELPWNTRSEESLDIGNAQKILEDDHYGLKDVKERVLEFLAVRQLVEQRKKAEKDAEKPAEKPVTPKSPTGEELPVVPGAEVAVPDAVVAKADSDDGAKGPILLFLGPP